MSNENPILACDMCFNTDGVAVPLMADNGKFVDCPRCKRRWEVLEYGNFDLVVKLSNVE